jgi:hypothetical protein
MLVPVVRHLKLAAILGFTLLTAGQLTFHNHSLIPEAGQRALLCGICAFSADPAIAPAPSERPLVVVWLLDAREGTTAPSGTPALLPARAPPATA